MKIEKLLLFTSLVLITLGGLAQNPCTIVEWWPEVDSVSSNTVVLGFQPADHTIVTAYQLKGRVMGTTGLATIYASPSGDFFDHKIINGLTAGTCYEWKIRAACADGDNTWVGPFTNISEPWDDFCLPAAKNLMQNEQKLDLFPNPASDLMNIEYHSSLAVETEIVIEDLFGRIIALRKNNSQEGSNLIQIDVSELTNGIYFVQVNQQDGHSYQQMFHVAN